MQDDYPPSLRKGSLLMPHEKLRTHEGIFGTPSEGPLFQQIPYLGHDKNHSPLRLRRIVIIQYAINRFSGSENRG